MNSWDKVRKFNTVETLEAHLKENGAIQLDAGQLKGRIRIGNIHHFYDEGDGIVMIQRVRAPHTIYMFEGDHLIKEDN